MATFNRKHYRLILVVFVVWAISTKLQAEISPEARMFLAGTKQYSEFIIDGMTKAKFNVERHTKAGNIWKREGSFSSLHIGDKVRYNVDYSDEQERQVGIMATKNANYHDGQSIFRYPPNGIMDIFDNKLLQVYIPRHSQPHLYSQGLELDLWRKQIDKGNPAISAIVEPSSDGIESEFVLHLKEDEGEGNFLEAKYWIDENKSFAVRKYEKIVNGKLIESVESILREDKAGNWIPEITSIKKWRLSPPMGTRTLKAIRNINYEEVETNIGLSPDELPINVPAGTWIIDNRTGFKYRAGIAEKIADDMLKTLTEKVRLEGVQATAKNTNKVGSSHHTNDPKPTPEVVSQVKLSNNKSIGLYLLVGIIALAALLVAIWYISQAKRTR